MNNAREETVLIVTVSAEQMEFLRNVLVVGQDEYYTAIRNVNSLLEDIEQLKNGEYSEEETEFVDWLQEECKQVNGYVEIVLFTVL